MRRIFALALLLSALFGLTACLDHESELEDAIGQYVQQRDAEAQAACQCYHLFVNFKDFDRGMFTSEEECLEALRPPPEGDVVHCMKGVLSAVNVDIKYQVDIIECYALEIAERADCYAQNADECSPTACFSDVDTPDECQGDLTDDEAQALRWCAVR